MIYICSDIHGCFDEFMELLRLIDFSNDDEMYIIGDVIDRGPKPIECIQYIMKTNNIHMLLGNHEEMMLNYLKLQTYNNYKSFSYAKDLWLQNGGAITLTQFSALITDEKLEIYNYLIKLALFKVLKSNEMDVLLVHAGIFPYDTGLVGNLSEQVKDDILWIREDFYCSNIVLPFKVIFGHTPTNYAYNDIKREKSSLLESYKENGFLYVNNKIGIDGGCCNGGNLLCLRLDDFKEYYISCKK